MFTHTQGGIGLRNCVKKPLETLNKDIYHTQGNGLLEQITYNKKDNYNYYDAIPAETMHVIRSHGLEDATAEPQICSQVTTGVLKLS